MIINYDGAIEETNSTLKEYYRTRKIYKGKTRGIQVSTT